MKVATYNVNGVNGRLDVLLRWLSEATPDIVVLQELKAPHARFPVKEIGKAGYGAVWHGQKSWNGVAILARGQDPMLTRKGLPGDPKDEQSRYIEAVVDGMVIGGLYLPNGNPYPGPKFDYKLRWLNRLHDYAAELLELEVPVILAGNYNVMPTELDVHKPERWKDDALFRIEVREAFRELVGQGWTDALRQLNPGERIYTFWDYFRNAYGRDAGLRLDHFLLSPDLAERLSTAEVDKHVRGWERTSDHAPVWIELADNPVKKLRK
ncbi:MULTISPECIES: exodeoxyribonuclease III [Agrobacterium]|uniref:Exodeoxyribonuclease III n=1 Tax=Agrobacterium rosae TaxID=1972867 RepID=A0A1R3TX85_9HYPH|nr:MULTISPECIES: exodeoxyribonuclease III [Agrobacterium]SCX20996.1 Exodeoxyribonuclease III [Agrobacterium sp. DSM 25558]SCX31389.1 Exodeoxyribonuclease III [Agrobacterium rosae]